MCGAQTALHIHETEPRKYRHFCLGFGGMSATNTKLFRFANFQSINCVHLESTKAAAHSSDKNIITSDNLAFNLRVPRWFNVGL